MRRILLMLLSSAAVLAVWGYDLANPALNPVELREPVPAVKPWPLFEKGREQFQIVTGPGGERGAQFLRDYFEKALGVDVTVSGWSATQIRKYPYRISIGDTPDAAKAKIASTNQPPQGFEIKSFRGGVAIVGNPATWEGCLFGAIDFAERVLGARFYFPGENGTLAPNARKLSVGPMWYADHPRVLVREGNFHIYAALRDPGPLVKYLGVIRKGDNSFFLLWRGAEKGFQRGHHFPDPKTLADKHPDKLDLIFYTDRKGKRWYNGQSIGSYFNMKSTAFADLMVEEYREFYALREKEGPKVDGPCDGEFVTFGTTDTAMDWDEQGAVDMNRLTRTFYKYLAGRVKKDLGKKLFILGYLDSSRVSDDPDFRLPGNVEINLCVFELPGRTRDAKAMAEVEKLFAGWYRELGNRKIARLWLYPRAATWPDRALTPLFYGDIQKKFGKYLANDGVFYDFAVSRDIWRHFYSAYAVYRLEWNPDWNLEAGLAAMFVDLLGAEAGQAMKAFIDEARAHFVTDFMPTGSNDAEFTPEHRASLAEKLAAVGKLLPKDDETAYNRFALAADPWYAYFKTKGVACAAPAAPKKKAKKDDLDAMEESVWSGENMNELKLD